MISTHLFMQLSMLGIFVRFLWPVFVFSVPLQQLYLHSRLDPVIIFKEETQKSLFQLQLTADL